MIRIEEILNNENILALRQEVLWQNESLEGCIMAEDKLETTFHIAAIDVNNNIVGTSTFIQTSNPIFNENEQYRLRAMATHPSMRGTGLGKKIMAKAIKVLEMKQVNLLWCDARQVAWGFYQNLNFNVKGDVYEVPLRGPHKLMYIKL